MYMPYQCHEEVSPVGEMQIHGLAGYSSGLGDFSHGHVGALLPRDELQRRIEDTRGRIRT